MTSTPFPSSASASLASTLAYFFGPSRGPRIAVVRPRQQGFSGNPIWCLHDPVTDNRYVLKAVGTAADRSQVAWRHAFIEHLREQGLDWLPQVCTCPTRSGQPAAFSRLVQDTAGTHWQCLTWVPGEPLPAPKPDSVAHATAALGRLHRLGRSFRQPFPTPREDGWTLRQRQFMRLATEGWPSLPVEMAERNTYDSEIVRWSAEAATIYHGHRGNAVATRLAGLRLDVPLAQPVLRDIWWGHVMFQMQSQTEQLFSGMIDFDAAAVDTPVTDMARLVGSWHLMSGNPEMLLCDRWPEAFLAYEEGAGLPKPSLWAVQIYHDTAIVCGLARWFEWLLQEGRVFPDMPAVKCRIEGLLRALPAALQRLGEISGDRLLP